MSGGMGSGGGMGGGRKGLFDDLAGMAGGAFSVLAGARQESEAMGRAQVDAMVQRLDLVKREDLDAALEVARRAREQAETLEARTVALEARITALEARLEGTHPPHGGQADPAQSGMPGGD